MPKITEERLNSFLDLVRLHHDDDDFHRIALDAERGLMDKIRAGDYQNIRISPFSKLQSGFGLIYNRPEKTYEYTAAAAITLFSRVVIDCGVTPDDAFDLSDALLLLLSEAKVEEEFHDIFQLAAVMFAKQVHDVRSEAGTYPVRMAQNYIRRNLFHKVTIKEVADYVSLSPNYLSQIFVKQTGITVHDFLQKERIAIACNLLSLSDRPITEISVHLGFESAANFSVVFRKWQGMTPTAYRNLKYKEVF